MPDLPILAPPVRSVIASNEHHLARVHPMLRPLVGGLLTAQLVAGVPVGITQSRRSDRFQRGLFAQGRALRMAPNSAGVWVVVDPKLVVTKAATGADTAHGCVCHLKDLDDADCTCAMAVDLAFLIDGRFVGPRPGPGNDSYDPDLPWHALAVRARDLFHLRPGAEFGESHPGALDGWDKGHFESPTWRALRAAHPAA